MHVRLTWPLGLVLGATLLSQAVWIFLDARRRGENQWLWGFFGLLNCPSSLLIYLLVTRTGPKPRCASCGRVVQRGWIACPYCGAARTGNPLGRSPTGDGSWEGR